MWTPTVNQAVLYLKLARSSRLTGAGQRTIADWAAKARNRDVQAALAARRDLIPELQVSLKKVRNARVAAAWASAWFRPEVHTDEYLVEERIVVLTALAALPALPDVIYEHCANRDRHSIAAALALNPDVPDSIVAKAIRTLTRDPGTTLALQRAVFVHPQMAGIVIEHTTKSSLIQNVLETPGVQITGDLATKAVAVFLNRPLRAASPGTLTSVVAHAGPFVKLYEMLDSGVLPIEAAKPLLPKILKTVQRARSATGLHSNTSVEHLIDLLSGKRMPHGAQATMAAAMASAPDGATLARLVETAEAKRVYSANIAAFASPHCTPKLIANMRPYSTMMKSRREMGLTTIIAYHLAAGRIATAAAITAQQTSPYLAVWLNVAREMKSGPYPSESFAAEVFAAACFLGYYRTALEFHAITNLPPSSLFDALPAEQVPALMRDDRFTSLVSDYLAERFGDDERLWERFHMMLSTSFHGTLTDLVNAVTNLATLDEKQSRSRKAGTV